MVTAAYRFQRQSLFGRVQVPRFLAFKLYDEDILNEEAEYDMFTVESTDVQHKALPVRPGAVTLQFGTQVGKNID